MFSEANELKVTCKLRIIEAVLRQIRGDVLDEFRHLLVLQTVEQPRDFGRVGRLIVLVRDRPVLSFAREHVFAFAGRIDRDAIENVRVDAHQMSIAQISRRCA